MISELLAILAAALFLGSVKPLGRALVAAYRWLVAYVVWLPRLIESACEIQPGDRFRNRLNEEGPDG